MITDKLTIYGDKENIRHIKELVDKCAAALDVKAVPAVVYAMCAPEETSLIQKGTECVILGYDDRELICDNIKKVTYSAKDSRSDVTALNIQKREQNQCFEILHGMYMSRVFIPLGSVYTPEQILVSATVLILWEAPFDKMILTINELLK